MPMKPNHSFVMPLATVKSVLTCLCCGFLVSTAASAANAKRERAEMEEATRLQVFLDRANFGPGKIDGRYGEFTTKALELYRTVREGPATGAAPAVPPIAEPPADAKRTPSNKGGVKDAAPDVSGLDLASVDPVFTSYTVTEEDAKNVGEVPAEPPDQAKLKWLPYRSVAEAVAEKFHSDIDFLEELNPGKTKGLKAGDTVTVPNVEPFVFSRGQNGKDSKGANEEEDAGGETKSKKDSESKKEPSRSLIVSTKSNMVEVHEGDRVIAAFPVTVGSSETNSPTGQWKVQRVTKLPFFRYDKQMLKHGERSADFHLLPPGPNNPVGVLWIALNKKGIGLHGTDSPDQIGRNASHGCIRLANWDVVKLAALVEKGTPVTIE
jgi:lipoprotein-anchoring transpeptidase ErfK/SrfK